jgi:hypothetical protein
MREIIVKQKVGFWRYLQFNTDGGIEESAETRKSVVVSLNRGQFKSRMRQKWLLWERTHSTDQTRTAFTIGTAETTAESYGRLETRWCMETDGLALSDQSWIQG